MKKILLSLSFFITVITVRAQHSTDVMDYINTYRDLAISEMLRTGVPASIKLAQGIHETGAGKSDLVRRSNNHFGIKCKANWTGAKVYHDDDARGECFRSYAIANDSYSDHSDFLKNSQRYAFLFKLDPRDYKGWAYGLKKAGYATNIRYSQILIKIIEEYNLQHYTLIALGEAKPSEEVFVTSKPAESAISEKNISTEVIASAPVNEAPPVSYPSGEFRINNTRVIYAPAGTSLLALAGEHNFTYSRLLDFNDMKDTDVLERAQLVYLQRKRKVANTDSHVVKEGETLHSISQAEGIRLESLARLNQLQVHMEPAAGQILFLKEMAQQPPKLKSDITVQQTSVVSARTSSKHIVQTKETLYSIARRYGVNVEQLKEWNGLPGADLKIGQELVIFKN